MAIVNDVFAARYLRGRDPIGQRISISRLKNREAEIVGVCDEIRQDATPYKGSPQMYVPFAQAPTTYGNAESTSSPSL